MLHYAVAKLLFCTEFKSDAWIMHEEITQRAGTGCVLLTGRGVGLKVSKSITIQETERKLDNAEPL